MHRAFAPLERSFESVGLLPEWPGNARELRSHLEQSVVLSEAGQGQAARLVLRVEGVDQLEQVIALDIRRAKRELGGD